MNSRDAIKLAIDMGDMISMGYLQDLTDEQMMQRPHPECNHLKWQIGHLIASERMLIEGVAPGSMPALPDSFAERYNKETAKSDDAGAFDSKEDLLRVYQEQRAGTLAALAKISDQELDKPSPESMRDYAPSVAAAFSMQGSHWIMHAGQMGRPAPPTRQAASVLTYLSFKMGKRRRVARTPGE